MDDTLYRYDGYSYVNNQTFIAGEDLRNYTHHALTYKVINGKLTVVRTKSSADAIIGWLYYPPNPNIDTTGEAVTVAISQARDLIEVVFDSSGVTVGEYVFASNLEPGKITSRPTPNGINETDPRAIAIVTEIVYTRAKILIGHY